MPGRWAKTERGSERPRVVERHQRHDGAAAGVRRSPLPVRERLIPKPKSSKARRLGIPTAMDRVVQASLVLVLEPIFEADFRP